MSWVVWFGRLAAVVLVLACLVVVGTIYAARAPNQFACLRFGRNNLVDLNTGLEARDTRPRTVQSLADSMYSSAPSPDGKYVAYLGPGANSGRLYVGLVGEEPRLVKDDVGWLAANAWSPDGSRLAYVRWVDGRSRVGILNADGSGEQIVSEDGDPSFVSWSPDGKYIALLSGGDSQWKQLGFWSIPGLQRMPFAQDVMLASSLVWDRQGHQLAFISRDPPQNVWLSLATPEHAKAVRFALPPDSYEHRISWSPDNRFVAVWYYSQWPNRRLDVFGVGGEVLLNVADTALAGDNQPQSVAVWSVDGSSLTFMSQQATGRDLIVYHLDSQIYETLVTRLSKPPFYSPDEKRMALYQRSGDEQGRWARVDLMDVDGRSASPLVARAADAGDPSWSPDGAWIAIVWAMGQQQQRVVRLTWARSDNFQRRDLDDGFWGIENVRWLVDGQSLAFIAERREGFSVEVANLETGALRRLGDGMARVVGLEHNRDTGQITFWWRRADGSSGVDGYSLDGTRLYRLEAAGSIDSPRMFWSPDGRVAALKLGPRSDETLQLASRDNALSQAIRSGLLGLGDPLWSPDSSMVAFTQAVRGVKNGQVTLEIVRADGSQVRQFDQYRGFFQNLAWTRCD
jgi:Tol biopolymer transport system component